MKCKCSTHYYYSIFLFIYLLIIGRSRFLLHAVSPSSETRLLPAPPEGRQRRRRVSSTTRAWLGSEWSVSQTSSEPCIEWMMMNEYSCHESSSFLCKLVTMWTQMIGFSKFLMLWNIIYNKRSSAVFIRSEGAGLLLLQTLELMKSIT